MFMYGSVYACHSKLFLISNIVIESIKADRYDCLLKTCLMFD